jgi:hypothetical protein
MLYPVYCYGQGCGKPAVYKIAARWSDAITEELKTYALCCEGCLPSLYAQSREKQKICRLAARETLEIPGIYRLRHGQRDRRLERMKELEKQLIDSTGNDGSAGSA